MVKEEEGSRGGRTWEREMSKRRTSFSDRDPIRSEKTEGETKSSGVRRSSEKAATGEGEGQKSSGPNSSSPIVSKDGKVEDLKLSGLSKKPEGFLDERKTEGGRGREVRVSGVNEREERRAGDTSSSSSLSEMKKDGAKKSPNSSFWSCESMRELTDVLLCTGGGPSRSDAVEDDAETTFLALSWVCDPCS